eukprot:1195210-Prorocentrum_minimum.AAC.2
MSGTREGFTLNHPRYEGKKNAETTAAATCRSTSVAHAVLVIRFPRSGVSLALRSDTYPKRISSFEKCTTCLSHFNEHSRILHNPYL